MTNWKIFEITKKNASSSSYIRFDLDGYVRFSDESEKRIYCVNSYPYYDWEEGDNIKIDVDRTCYYKGTHDFDNSSIVKKISSSDSGALVRAQANYNALQTTYNDLRSSNSGLQQRTYDLQDQVAQKERDIEWGKGQLEIKQNQLTAAQSSLATSQQQLTVVRNDLVTKQNQYDGLVRDFTALQIESNNKDQEIGSQKSKIKELGGLLIKSRGEIIKHKIETKESRLETFIREIGVRRAQVRDLRNAYQKLIQAQEDCNLEDIRTADDKLEEVKDDLLDNGVSVENMQNLCRKCEKIAKLRIEREKLYQEQYQAQVEVNPNT